MGPFPKNKACLLHNNRVVCLCAVALCSAALVRALVLLNVNPNHNYWVTYASAAAIWVFFDFARHCKRLVERSFYCVGLVYYLILGVQSAIPISGAAFWTAQLFKAALCAIDIALSGSILIWHLRHGSRRQNSTTQAGGPSKGE